MKGNLSAASEAGVPIALGTDTDNPQVFPGFAVHEELELMVEGGLSEAEALKAATVTAAGFLDQHEHLGKLQSGFNADIVALRRNPLADIRNTRAIEFVVVGGARVSNAVAIP
jgi:imidazolonepropionase-like amidohydrolase